MHYPLKSALVALSLWSLLVACADSVHVKQSTKVGVANGSVAAASGAMVKRTINPTPGKVGAPVILSYTLPRSVQPGEVASVTLELSSRTVDGSMEVLVEAQEDQAGLVLAAPITQRFELARGRSYNLEVPITTLGSGLFYLNVIAAETDANGTARMSRAFAVPVQVGDAPLQKKSNGVLVDTPSGERLIQMPAEES